LGGATCESVDTWLTWSEHDIEILVDGGKRVTLGAGESKVQGDYELKNFRSALSSGPGTGTCSDAFVADTTVRVARTAPLFEQPRTGVDAEADAGSDVQRAN
jgi:hypothetical protein